MKQLLLVFFGGGVGSALRYLAVKSLGSIDSLPIGTLTVNVVGSCIIGALLGLSFKEGWISTNTSLLLATGFCGGFTTFSAFSLENQLFLRSGDYLTFGLYTAGSIILGIAAVFLGLFLVRLL